MAATPRCPVHPFRLGSPDAQWGTGTNREPEWGGSSGHPALAPETVYVL